MARAEDFVSGEKVFIDSMAGLLPATVIGPGDTPRSVKVKHTATRGPWVRDEVGDWLETRVVKRSWVRVRGGEHGQWWVSVLMTTDPYVTGEHTYSAVDAVPGYDGRGIDFEEVG